MILSVKELKKSYRQGGHFIEVLHGVNLDVEKPSKIAITGQSGSGKSTLLSLLSGLDRPDSGSVTIEGNNISDMPEQKLTEFRAQNTAIVFQQFYLMPSLSAVENVALPLEIQKVADATLRAEEALNQVGLSNRLHHFPNQLSGGENQRVAIARAFVTKPKVLLADEPTGNLDESTSANVFELLLRVVDENETLMILVTHNLDLAKSCNRILTLRDGILTEIN